RDHFQSKDEIARRLEPLIWTLFEAVFENPVELAGNLVSPWKFRRVVPQNSSHRLAHRVAAERALSCQHLVENAAEREDIAARIYIAAGYLFWSDVTNSPHDSAGVGVHLSHRWGRDIAV